MQQCSCCCNNNNATSSGPTSTDTYITRQRLSDDAIVLGLTTIFSVITLVSWVLYLPL